MAARRRKTLSHSDIENFLSEISTNTPLPTAGKQENAVVKPARQRIEDDAAPAQEIAPPAVASATIAPKLEEDQVLIRKFCKLVMRDASRGIDVRDEEVKSLATDLMDRTKYQLISSHLVSDSPPKYCSGSVEAKKALLLSLSPMLTEAEEERKRDTQACEEFTRCKFNKVRSHMSTYEYLDLDTGHRVDYAEYESRYLLYINRNRAPCRSVPASIPPLLSEPSSEPLVMDVTPSFQTPEEPLPKTAQPNSPLLENESIGAFRPVPDDVPVHYISPKYSSKKFSHNDRKRKHEHNDQGARRGTLSPGSMKAILLANLKAPSLEDQNVAVLTAITHTVQQGTQDLSIDVANDESSDYMDCDLSVSFSKGKTSKRKGKRRHTLSPSGLVELSRRPSLLLSALEAGAETSPSSLVARASHDSEEKIDLAQSPCSLSQGSTDESSGLDLADTSSSGPVTPMATTLPAAEALFHHLEGDYDAMELDHSLRSRANSVGSATKSSPTYALVLSSEPLPTNDLDGESSVNHLLHSISPDGLVSADDDTGDREMLELEFTDELEDLVRERSESPVQQLFASATDEIGNSDVESDEEADVASLPLAEEDEEDEEALVDANEEAPDADCDAAIEEVEVTEEAAFKAGGEREVVEEQRESEEIAAAVVEATIDLVSAVVDGDGLPEEAGADVATSDTTPDGDGQEGGVAAIELDSIRVPPLTPLPPVQSWSRVSSPNAPSPFTNFFGQRSALQTLLQEALQIMLPYHNDPNPHAHTASTVEDDLRTFQLIEELVWKHVESEMQSSSTTSASFLRGLSVVSQSSDASEMEAPVTLPISALMTTTTSSDTATATTSKASPDRESARGVCADAPVVWDPTDIPSEMDETASERRAHKRLRERMAEVRSRYLWEVVSVQTANASIRRAQRLVANAMP